MSDALVTLLYLAVAVEFITETLRQGLPLLQRLPARWLAAVIGVLICYLTNRGLLAPVSYTHLDVYKRQGRPCLSVSVMNSTATAR